MYNKQTWLDEIPDITRPILDSSGKQKTDPQTGRPLFELVQAGTRITSNRLNTMEGGIESAHTLVEKLAKEMGGNFVAVIDDVMGLVCSAEGLKASWTAGVAYVGGRRYEITAGEMPLNPTQGQYLYVDVDGVVKKTTSQITAKSGLLLFYVATDTSGVISTTDQRVNLSVQEAYEVALEAKQLGNERKADVVAALIAMGVTASTSDTWSHLITKMTEVIKSKGNAMPSDVRVGKRFSNSEEADIVGALPERSTDTLTIIPGVSTKTNPPGIYGGDIIVPGEPNLLGENILVNKSIYGVPGSLVPNKVTEYPAQSKSLRTNTAGYSFIYDTIMELNPNKRNLILFPGLTKSYTQAYSAGYPDNVTCVLAVRTQNRIVQISNTIITSSSQSNLADSRSTSFGDISVDLAAKKITCVVNNNVSTYTIDDPNPSFLRLVFGVAKYRVDNYTPMVESFGAVRWEAIAFEY
nr:hypothetical protein [Paenibacillus xylanexedens]